jgi:glucoamylase
MPLVWAHAEYLKLRRSLRDGRVYDLPPQARQRYVVERTRSPHAIWRFNHKIQAMPAGRRLRIQTLAPSIVHWSADDWRITRDATGHDTGLGEYVVDLPTESLPAGAAIVFTFRWPDADRWEGTDFRVAVDGAE